MKFTKTSLAAKFDELDENGDGILSLSEATNCLRFFYGEAFPLSTICGIFNTLDTNRDGTVDKDEYMTFMMEVITAHDDHEFVIEHDEEYSLARERDLIAARDHNDLRGLLSSKTRLRALFDRHDTNHNQLLEREEWPALLIELGMAEPDEKFTMSVLYDYLDTDKSEGIDWEEFQTGIGAAFDAMRVAQHSDSE
ncbi:hypothetical protein KIPB_005266 [Kipferlia bialata]|uniref:EF-hand domain-containing protein n=1 Tax=Kipferlia bialata TaxID=797122 RepID=A0A9K3CY93_9EUKA|nr:hypothetical protein KIPB_005266 [Kipferlia bialata]|eukprot:g5266.t1